jgi:hypothetical protein
VVVPETTVFVRCPYCGEPIELLVDATLPNQKYIEDCEVCCRPMVVEVDATADEPVVSLRRENE